MLKKSFFGVLMILLATVGSSAQVPRLINYQGLLTDAAGNPMNGSCSIQFKIYNSATGGTAIWTETHTVTVNDGLFDVRLGSITLIEFDVFDGSEKYLSLKVNDDPEMTPRKPLVSVGYSFRAYDADRVDGHELSTNDGTVNQDEDPVNWYKIKDIPAGFADGTDDVGSVGGISQINVGTGMTVTNPTGPTATLDLSMGHGNGINTDMLDGQHAADFSSASHNHLKQMWDMGSALDNGLVLTGTIPWDGSPLKAYNYGSGPGIYGLNTGSGNGVAGSSENNDGIFGMTSASDKSGVFGYGTSGLGVSGRSVDNYGVLARSDNSHSIYVPASGAAGVKIESATENGIDVVNANHEGVLVRSAGRDGIMVGSANWSGVYVADANYDALRVQKAGQDGLRIFENVGRNYIRLGSDADPDFIFDKGGDAYADSGWFSSADFAELIEVEGSLTSYEPGDVLVISDDEDRSVELSSQPYSTSVMGVYSTKPGFIGSSHPMKEKFDNEIPVAITGIVPCKVSTENGPVKRGDLLTTSNSIGYAMKATEPKVGTILGKALESLENGMGKIEVFVILQ